MATTLITDVNELESAIRKVVKSAILEANQELRNDKRIDQLYTINQLSKLWKKSHKTVTKMVNDGLLRTTTNGLIPESAINEYLQNH